MSVLLKSLITVVQERNQPVDITLGFPDILLQSLMMPDNFCNSEIPLSGFCCSVNIFCGYLYYKEYQATRNSNITKEETITIIKEER